MAADKRSTTVQHHRKRLPWPPTNLLQLSSITENVYRGRRQTFYNCPASPETSTVAADKRSTTVQHHRKRLPWPPTNVLQLSSITGNVYRGRQQTFYNCPASPETSTVAADKRSTTDQHHRKHLPWPPINVLQLSSFTGNIYRGCRQTFYNCPASPETYRGCRQTFYNCPASPETSTVAADKRSTTVQHHRKHLPWPPTNVLQLSSITGNIYRGRRQTFYNCPASSETSTVAADKRSTTVQHHGKHLPWPPINVLQLSSITGNIYRGRR